MIFKFDLKSRKFENFELIRRFTMTIKIQFEDLKSGDVTTLPLEEILSRDLGVRRIQGVRIGTCYLDRERRIMIVRTKESLGPRVAYPLVQKL
jgi:hypothetical protein